MEYRRNRAMQWSTIVYWQRFGIPKKRYRLVNLIHGSPSFLQQPFTINIPRISPLSRTVGEFPKFFGIPSMSVGGGRFTHKTPHRTYTDRTSHPLGNSYTAPAPSPIHAEITGPSTADAILTTSHVLK